MIYCIEIAEDTYRPESRSPDKNRKVLLVKGERDEDDDDFEIKPKKVKVKGKKSKGKRFKDNSEDVEVSKELDSSEDTSDDTESINK